MALVLVIVGIVVVLALAGLLIYNRMIFDELIGGDTVPMSEMRDRIPEHSATWRAAGRR